MPTPKEVFDNPLQYLDFLQSANFEGQYFERKEVRIDTRNQINTLKDKIKQCISAFANSNRAGGLLILGVTDDGTLKGTQHVDEQTLNGILQVARDLRDHATQLEEVVLPNSNEIRLHLLYTPWISNSICETVGNLPQAWKRVGAQNFVLIREDQEQLKRDKKMVDFEMLYCCPYNPNELDRGVVEEFKREFLATRDAQYDYSTEELLLNVGAIVPIEDNKYAFTKSGYLFFTEYPRKYLPGAYVRVLRFEVDVEESGERGVTTFDKDFEGALPNIIRKLRTFFRDSALFRTITKRSSHGGFIEEPEYPLLAVDEAIVNAVIHRDYGFSEAIHCIAYRNGLSVENPGGILQQVPKSFSLADTVLTSVLRNPKIVEWMRLLKDERGEPLVRALREGTRRMRQEMENLGLPAPHYDTDRDTIVKLYNRLEERLEPHAYAHTKDTRNNTPSTSSGQGNVGKMSGFIGESAAQKVENGNKTHRGLSDLPNGWEWTTLQEVCSTPQYGWTTRATTQGTLHLLRTTDITSGNVDWGTVPFCQVVPPNTEKFLLKTGDIVISRAGSVGYSYLVKNPQNAVFASYLIRFRPLSIIDENYLAFFLKSPSYWKTISSEKAGIALLNVNATKLKRIEIPLPPLAEQNRIVKKINNLFTQLDAGVDSVKKAQVQLQRYRRSILKAAFVGELTKKWRAENSEALESILVSEVATPNSLPKLPNSWIWTTLGEISEIILGQSPPSSTYNTDGEGLPFYQGKLEFGKLYPTPRKWCTAPKRIAEKGDVFISIRAPVGPTNICPEKSAVGRGLAAIRSSYGIQPFFIFYLLRRFENEIASKGTGTTFKAITGNQLKTFQIPLPSLQEQKQIVSELERCLSVADEVEATIASELARSERLRQSILKQAFSGKLVYQDPNDEPASVLLKQIKGEKSRQQTKRKKTITKSKTQDGDNYPLLTLAGALGQNDDSLDDASMMELRGDKSE